MPTPHEAVSNELTPIITALSVRIAQLSAKSAAQEVELTQIRKELAETKIRVGALNGGGNPN